MTTSMYPQESLKKLLNIVCYLLPLICLLLIWVPVIRHYHISNILITDTMVEQARHVPDDSILDELNSNEFRGLGIDYQWDNEKKLIERAEKVLLGIIPGLPHKIKMPFSADDFSKGLPGEQLQLAGFFVPDLLLSAYQVTGREEFLTTARDVILAWASYERRMWLPRGMIWNDYAIAARNETLSKFWAIYRNHRNYQPEVAKTILQLAARSGELLAKPSHFTVSTNHGIIQNLALLRICLAFPALPDVEQYKQIAMRRLYDQMTFYINDEGVVLEHSAHYQQFGVHLTGMLFRYLTLMNEPIPHHWEIKYEKAKDYLAELRRPDGSLPMYGDTHSHGNSLHPPVTRVDDNGISIPLAYRTDWIPKSSNSIYPVAGYSVWWDGLDTWPDEHKLNQTTVIWSYFPGHGHKHADEMSVLLYAGGQRWWTNAGYWTYGTKGRSEAESWDGSNAPHLVDESTNSARKAELKNYGWSDNLSVIDLQRSGPGEYAARRQVIHIKPNLWLIVDHTSGDKKSRTTTKWTTPNDVVITDGKLPGSYDLKVENKSAILTALFINSDGSKIERYRGSYTPFAGWVMNEPADALVIEQPANNSWSVAIWSLGNPSASSMHVTGKPYMHNWESPESWEIVLPVQLDQLSIRREGNSVYVNGDNKTHNIQEVKLKEAPAGIADNYNAIRTAYKNAANKYPQFKNLLHYRWKMTYFLIFILIIQEVFFIMYRKGKGKYYTGLRTFCIFGWISVIALWQVIVYLKG